MSIDLSVDPRCASRLVFNPKPLIWLVKYVMDKIDLVLLMSVNPGFGGQSFIPSTLDKLQEARALIDASGQSIDWKWMVVGPGNIAEIAAAGADTFVAGSAIFNQPSYEAVIAQCDKNWRRLTE